MLEGNHKEKVIPSTIEDEVQIIPPLLLAQRVPAFIKTLQDSTLHYNKLWTKRPHSSLGTPFKCEKHPFFEDLSTSLRK